VCCKKESLLRLPGLSSPGNKTRTRTRNRTVLIIIQKSRSRGRSADPVQFRTASRIGAGTALLDGSRFLAASGIATGSVRVDDNRRASPTAAAADNDAAVRGLTGAFGRPGGGLSIVIIFVISLGEGDGVGAETLGPHAGSRVAGGCAPCRGR